MSHFIWLFSFLRPYSMWIVFTWILSVAIIILQSASVWVSVECIQNILLQQETLKRHDHLIFQWLDGLVDQLLMGKSPFEIITTGALFLCSALLAISAMRYLKSFIFININERVLAHIRTLLFGHISCLDLFYSQNIKTGETESILFHDIDNLTHTIIDSVDRLFMQPLRIIFFTYLIYILSSQLCFFLYLMILVGIPLTHYWGKFIQSKSKTLMEKTANLHGNAVEYLSIAVIARIFNREKQEQQRWQKKSLELADARIRHGVIRDVFPLFTELLKVISLFLIICIGGYKVYVENSLDSAALAKVILLIPLLLYPVEALATLYGAMRTSLASLHRIRSIFTLQTEVVQYEDDNNKNIPDSIFPITINGLKKELCGHVALNRISCKIEKGDTILLYGPSGSGKSTLLALLAGMSIPDSGDILLGNQKLAELNMAKWRNRIGIVLQESLFFNGSIRENLLYVAPGADDITLMTIIRQIFKESDRFCNDNILDTSIGNLGSILSGGERQRLSIVRTLLTQPEILLLDEPTSDLDEVNRQIIRETLTRLNGNMTLIIATHDMTLKSLANKIFTLDNGVLREHN